MIKIFISDEAKKLLAAKILLEIEFSEIRDEISQREVEKRMMSRTMEFLEELINEGARSADHDKEWKMRGFKMARRIFSYGSKEEGIRISIREESEERGTSEV